jgi:hypothetical protein
MTEAQEKKPTMHRAKFVTANGTDMRAEELSLADIDSMTKHLGCDATEWNEIAGDPKKRFALVALYHMCRFDTEENRMADKPLWSWDVFLRFFRVSDVPRLNDFLEANPAFLSVSQRTSEEESTEPADASISAGTSASDSAGESSASS